jgi:DNA polymerase kappa
MGDRSITAYCEANGVGPDECVQEMRQRVFEKTKLTVSAGIAPNKVRCAGCRLGAHVEVDD